MITATKYDEREKSPSVNDIGGRLALFYACLSPSTSMGASAAAGAPSAGWSAASGSGESAAFVASSCSASANLVSADRGRPL